MRIDMRGLHWQSDWNGDEVGYPEVNVVGLYSAPELPIDMYIDMETLEVLEMMYDEEEYVVPSVVIGISDNIRSALCEACHIQMTSNAWGVCDDCTSRGMPKTEVNNEA